jgi:hypothetical protein
MSSFQHVTDGIRVAALLLGRLRRLASLAALASLAGRLALSFGALGLGPA